ncbi:MAG: hypothetical protein JJ850_17265 [Kordiimonadaceae bacterium]|nr:hypothetical protein [Kordiimonadaceae bacterium]MBO6570506.1 hypothetical protein [Kordiimonadaceae bacterium]MBO6966375.1 hypothetical protein [Kordiimonadaceae bacterium]
MSLLEAFRALKNFSWAILLLSAGCLIGLLQLSVLLPEPPPDFAKSVVFVIAGLFASIGVLNFFVAIDGYYIRYQDAKNLKKRLLYLPSEQIDVFKLVFEAERGFHEFDSTGSKSNVPASELSRKGLIVSVAEYNSGGVIRNRFIVPDEVKRLIPAEFIKNHLMAS